MDDAVALPTIPLEALSKLTVALTSPAFADGLSDLKSVFGIIDVLAPVRSGVEDLVSELLQQRRDAPLHFIPAMVAPGAVKAEIVKRCASR